MVWTVGCNKPGTTPPPAVLPSSWKEAYLTQCNISAYLSQHNIIWHLLFLYECSVYLHKQAMYIPPVHPSWTHAMLPNLNSQQGPLQPACLPLLGCHTYSRVPGCMPHEHDHGYCMFMVMFMGMNARTFMPVLTQACC